MAELSIRYASALLDLTVQEGMLNECLQQAVEVRDVLLSGECGRFLEHPHISDSDKREFLDGIFTGLHDNLTVFLHFLIAKSWENLIVPALTAFIEMAKFHSGKTTANVVSATELSESQICAIKDVLSRKLVKEVEISLKTDPSLIGGFYIHVDGRLIDRTVKKRLSDLKDHIKKGVLNEQQAR